MSDKLQHQLKELYLLKGQLIHHEIQSRIELPLQVYDFIRTSRVSLQAAIRDIEAIQESEAALARTDAALLELVASNRQTTY